MVDEINGASAKMNKTSKVDDPVSMHSSKRPWPQLTQMHSCPKLSVCSTVISRSCSRSTRGLQHCRPRLRLRREPTVT